MPTAAELSLAHEVARGVLTKPDARLLNIGSGSSLFVERCLPEDAEHRVDRVDIAHAAVDHPCVGQVWQCSVEDMQPVPSGVYSAVFANYVLEHVEDLGSAAREMARVLQVGGLAVFSVPNPRSPEFVVSRLTSTAFHRLVRRGGDTWPALYSYRSIPDLAAILCSAGFRVVRLDYYPAVGSYLCAYRTLAFLGRWYDRAVARLGRPILLGHCCMVLVKTGEAPTPS